MTALIDVLIYLIPMLGAAIIIYALVSGICGMISKIRRASREAADMPRIIHANRAEIRRRLGNG